MSSREENTKEHQAYLPNTNILLTTITQKDGSSYQITDFCPRFYQHGRTYRPTSLFRILESKSGSPVIRVQCRPVEGWSKTAVEPVRGNSHLRWKIRETDLKLATNMPMTYLCEEIPFVLEEPLYFGLTWGVGIEDDLPKTAHQFLEQSIDYWRTWVKHCSIPTLYQKETIRSALALKLHCYEDTGAILAALTTSLPEEIGGKRNWDYRFCWLRDAYFVLSAFRNLGHFEEMEGFLKFLLNIAHQHEHSKERLAPVYALDGSLPIPEVEHPNWSGYKNSRPVRSRNQAAEHIQNDVYGEMILTLAPIFLDERFHHLRTRNHENLITDFVKICIQSISKPDAGLWEIRQGWQEHSFSNLMCWAGIDRALKIKSFGFLQGIADDLDSAKRTAEHAIRAAIIDGSLRNGPQDPTFDAALLQLPILRFPDLDLNRLSVQSIHQALAFEGHERATHFLHRYRRKDDFGHPQAAFVICSFWLAQAYAAMGNLDKAEEVMKEIEDSANLVGLFSEHYRPHSHEQSGNFPQGYSHVGQINAAFAISPGWNQLL